VTWKAVLFDLDGTLLDTLDDLADSMNAALESLGFPGYDAPAYRYFVGGGLDTMARNVLPENHWHPVTIDKCVARFREEYAARRLDKTRPYDGVPDLLDTLAARGIRLAVLSNKPDDFTRQLVTDLLPARRFEVIMGACAELPTKPDPTSALLVADRMHLEPPNFLYLGDSNIDMQTANAAGMFPVGVLWGFRDESELRQTGARALLREPTELLGLLG